MPGNAQLLRTAPLLPLSSGDRFTRLHPLLQRLWPATLDLLTVRFVSRVTPLRAPLWLTSVREGRHCEGLEDATFALGRATSAVTADPLGAATSVTGGTITPYAHVSMKEPPTLRPPKVNGPRPKRLGTLLCLPTSRTSTPEHQSCYRPRGYDCTARVTRRYHRVVLKPEPLWTVEANERTSPAV